MKTLFKNKTAVNLFLFCMTFCLLYFLIQWVTQEIQYPVSWKSTAEGSLAVSLIMILLKMGNDKGKKREYKDIEYGSSHWGTEKDRKPYIDEDPRKNIILSQTEFLSMNQEQTHLDCHSFIIGATASGKSRFYALPNIMQMNASYVITDPNGSLLWNTGKMLEGHGYKVKVFDVEHMENSLRFNPFHYCKEPEDIMRFVKILIANTNGGVQKGVTDANFWDNCENLWFLAHIAYIQETCLEEEKNMNSLILLLDHSKTKEEDEDYKSAVDVLFDDLEQENPNSFAVRQYKKFKLGAGKSMKSILLSVAVRLTPFDIPKVADLLSEDEMELEKAGNEKTALFILVSDTDTTFDFIVAILLDVMCKLLSKEADDSPEKHLKIPVRFILDEIANIGAFPDLDRMVSVLRKRWVSIEMLFQNLGQLKALYKDKWETIISNCASVLFLGGSGEITTRYISHSLLGKATIDTVSYGGGGTAGSLGKNSYNSNEQKNGRYLMDETELAHLDRSECITNIRGAAPFKGKKYDPKKHPNYKYLAEADSRNAYRLHNRGFSLQNPENYYVTVSLQEEKQP